MKNIHADISAASRELLCDIKKRPAAYLGSKSLTALMHFLQGISYERQDADGVIPVDLTDFTASYYNDNDSLDVFKLVLKHEAGERAAFDKFFELLGEYLVSFGFEPLGETEPEKLTDIPHADGKSSVVYYSDLEPIAASFADTFNAPPWNDEWTLKTAYDRLRSLYYTPGFLGLCLWKDGKPVSAVLGSGEHYYDGRVFRIVELWTDKDNLRKGYAASLMNELLSILKKRGYIRVYLLTMRHTAAEELYSSCGFELGDDMGIFSINL